MSAGTLPPGDAPPAPAKRFYGSRPSGSEVRRRAKVVGFRATDAERAEIQAAADRAGLTPSSYIRAQALKKPTMRATRRAPVNRAALAQLLGQIGRVGSNLNQIARQLNSGRNEADVIGLPEALAELHGMKAVLMAALGRGTDDDPDTGSGPP